MIQTRAHRVLSNAAATVAYLFRYVDIVFMERLALEMQNYRLSVWFHVLANCFA